VFVGPHKDSKKVFVVNQQHPRTGKFNEHKVLLGYHDRAHALRDYAHSFSDGQGHKRIQSVVEMGTHQLKDWLKKDHTQPLKMAGGGPVDAPYGDTFDPAMAGDNLVAPSRGSLRSAIYNLTGPERQSAIDGKQAISPSLEGMGQGMSLVGEGVQPLGEMAGDYARSRYQDPSQLLGDIQTAGKSIAHGIYEDPAGFIGGINPFVAAGQAGTSISDIKDAAQAAKERGDTDAYRKLSAAATAMAMGVGIPGLHGVGEDVARSAMKDIERKAIQPSTRIPTQAEIDAARADTRVGGDIVGQRLNVLVPEAERVVGGEYTPGAPGGGRWADLPPEFLEARGKGFHMTDEMQSAQAQMAAAKQALEEAGPAERPASEKAFNAARAELDQANKGGDAVLQSLWDDAVNESSQAAKNAVDKNNVRPTFSADDWHNAMQTPYRDHLWYELSGEKFHENLPDLTPAEHRETMDLVGATSARADPNDNLRRTLSVTSQKMRGVPADVDLTTESTVRDALARQGDQSSALSGNKTGHFSDTLTLTGGVPTRFPISVNDVWVGRMFGVPDSVMSSNQSLHEPMARYFNKIRDLYNDRMEPAFPYQSWNFQAPSWVYLRPNETGDAYHQVWGDLIKSLNDRGVPGVNGDVITREALMHPEFVNAMRPSAARFREAPKATVEFGTTQTPAGAQALEMYNEALQRGDTKSAGEYLKNLTTAMYASSRGDHPWDALKKAVTGDTRSTAGITRIAQPTSERPLDIGGTFEGAVSPNIRVPLRDMNDDHIAMFNAVAGQKLKQDAMAVSHIMEAQPGSDARDGYVRGHSLFMPTTEDLDPAHIRQFAREIGGHGHDMSYVRYPNGYNFDILPNFSEDVPKGVTPEALHEAYTNSLGNYYSAQPSVVPHDFKSVYTPASDYEGLRKQLTQGMKDDFVKQASQSGADEAATRAIAEGAPLPADFPRGGKKAWDTYQKRLGHLTNAEEGFAGLADRIEQGNADFIQRAGKRFSKAPQAKAEGGQVTGYAKGGEVRSLDLPVPLTHYSRRPDLTEVDPSYYGTNNPGEDVDRTVGRPDGNPRRSYFYVGHPGDVMPEHNIGEHAYTTSSNNLYDLSKDPLNVRRGSSPRDLNRMEQVIRAHGYEGVLNNDAAHPTAVMFEKKPVTRHPATRTMAAQSASDRLSKRAVADFQDFHKRQGGDVRRSALVLKNMKGANLDAQSAYDLAGHLTSGNADAVRSAIMSHPGVATEMSQMFHKRSHGVK
jgi:hypothetical protein